MDTVFQPYEAHVPYRTYLLGWGEFAATWFLWLLALILSLCAVLQFLVDYNLTGMGFLTASTGK